MKMKRSREYAFMFVTFKSTETRKQLTVKLLGKMILFCLAAVPTDLNVFF